MSSSSSSEIHEGKSPKGEQPQPSQPPQPQLEKQQIMENNTERTVTILSHGPNHIIALKPPSVICHHSNWAGSRKKKLKPGEEPEIPMLQRVRDGIHSIDYDDDMNNDTNNDTTIDNGDDENAAIKKINLVHRLDRGASGVLLFAYANDHDNNSVVFNDTNGTTIDIDTDNDSDSNSDKVHNVDAAANPNGTTNKKRQKIKGPTAILQEEMSKSTTTKTYVALVRGEGILKGEDLKEKGWFEVNRPIKDENGKYHDAVTLFRFVASQAEPELEMESSENDDNSKENSGQDKTDNQDHDYERKRILQPRLSLVLARPQHGRWHQIRRHLNGLSSPILGDSTHGSSKTNREWKQHRNLKTERICLHLARLQMPPTMYTPDGIDCAAPLHKDMLTMLEVYAPSILEEALPVLQEEGILIDVPKDNKYTVGTYKIPDKLLQKMMEVNKPQSDDKSINEDNVSILSQGDTFVVVGKPPGVVVHNSRWTAKRRNEPTPMLQQVRNAVGRKVNPVHRLDRSASGCLVFAYADNDDKKGGENSDPESREVTKALITAMQNEDAEKTYIALCDGDGDWNGINYMEKGWFTMDSPVKDENGKLNDAETDFLFVTGMTLPTDNDDIREGRKVSIVLARPKTGKYHQIRQHLASGTIGHAIIGDSSHGRSRTNRIWKKKRHLIKERTCLHLIKIKLPPTKYTGNGIEAFSPLPYDLMVILNAIPGLLDKARRTLFNEGIKI